MSVCCASHYFLYLPRTRLKKEKRGVANKTANRKLVFISQRDRVEIRMNLKVFFFSRLLNSFTRKYHPLVDLSFLWSQSNFFIYLRRLSSIIWLVHQKATVLLRTGAHKAIMVRQLTHDNIVSIGSFVCWKTDGISAMWVFIVICMVLLDKNWWRSTMARRK